MRHAILIKTMVLAVALMTPAYAAQMEASNPR